MPKRPRDLNQLAARTVQAATEGEPDLDTGKNPDAVRIGRAGRLVGGKARAAKLTPERRREIAQRAAAARWSTNQSSHGSGRVQSSSASSAASDFGS